MAAAALSVVQRRLCHNQRDLDCVSQTDETIVQLRRAIERLNLVPEMTQLPYCSGKSFSAAYQPNVVSHDVLNGLHVALDQGGVRVSYQSAFVP